jgi:hypothetical protein
MKKLEDALADACNAMGALPENFALDGSIYRFVTDTVVKSTPSATQHLDPTENPGNIHGGKTEE